LISLKTSSEQTFTSSPFPCDYPPLGFVIREQFTGTVAI
jgi:hypothetical protein